MTQTRRATIRFTEEEWQALERGFEQAPRRLSWNAWAVMMLLRGTPGNPKREA